MFILAVQIQTAISANVLKKLLQTKYKATLSKDLKDGKYLVEMSDYEGKSCC